MADRPMSNRRKNYSRRVSDVDQQETNPWHDDPEASDQDASYDGYTDEVSEQEPYGHSSAARNSVDDTTTLGRKSGEFHDAYNDTTPYEDDYDESRHRAAAPSSTYRSGYEDEVDDDQDARNHMTDLYADHPNSYNQDRQSQAREPRRYAPGTRNYDGSSYQGAYEDPSMAQHNVPIERPRDYGQEYEPSDKIDDDEQYQYDARYPEATDDEDPEAFPAFFNHEVGQFGEFNLFSRIYLEMRQMLSFSLTSLSLLLLGNLAFGMYFNPFRKSPPKARCDPEFEKRITGERLSERVQYYAEFWGYKCEEHEIITREGWILKAHRISDPRRGSDRGYPVILQHGILCNSLFFFTNEERSLGFWLVDQGFDVWSTNIRSNYKAGHTRYDRWDPRFWAWSMMELAYDLVDVVNYVVDNTQYSQTAFIGHSQGTASMFLALSHGKYPELGQKLSSFTAMGPAVFPGPSLKRLPFRLMAKFHSRFAWSLIFGVRDFFPIIEVGREILPAFVFGHLAFLVFVYLFNFHDHNWVNRLKPKIFRSTGVSTSSELLYFYMRSFVGRGCLFDPKIPTPWFPRQFPPLTVVYGTTDYLVLGKPLINRLLHYEKNVEIVHILELQGYEHMDMVLGVDAYKVVFPKIKDTILRTMDPEDMPGPSKSKMIQGY
ncbi:sterol esterase [Malassezia yamatoensis]|uniref:Sterol esterase n=1 Tax=Malassezia yamatoensis TaxID=253288 RepID=A0AAJ5YQI8_9BASI|nr:sterol esterase [Malassezia yamatoensis]